LQRPKNHGGGREGVGGGKNSPSFVATDGGKDKRFNVKARRRKKKIREKQRIHENKIAENEAHRVYICTFFGI
jgi:hypothetical protein